MLDERYSRNMPSITQLECGLLQKSHVCVIGCGGLGGYIIEILARAGVGTLTVIDGDVFDVSNLNRQLLCEEEFLGRNKAEIAALRVSRINSDVRIHAKAQFFTPENGDLLLDGCDLAIDALDNIQGRITLEEACSKAGILLVHGAISGWSAQASVVPPGSGLLKKLYPPRAGMPTPRGNPGFTASLCASIQACEAVKLLCGRPSALDGKLLIIDLRTMDFSMLEL